MSRFIGVDLGGTNMKAVGMTRQGAVLAEKEIPTDAHQGSQQVIQRLIGLIQELEQQMDSQITAAGITVPGIVRMEQGIAMLLPNFPDQWKGVPIKSLVEEQVRFPVSVLNDARAATFGEKYFGAGKSYHNYISLIIGTGVGGGIIQDGTLLFGSRGGGGELGHQTVVPDGLICGCGKRGCLETVASGPALVTAAIRYVKQGLPTKMRELVNGDLNAITPEIIHQAAQLQDEPAIQVLSQAADHIATVILNMIAALNPEAVMIGGGLSKSDLLLKLIEQKVKQRQAFIPADLWDVKVLKAQFENQAGAIGAAAWAMKQVDEAQHTNIN